MWAKRTSRWMSEANGRAGILSDASVNEAQRNLLVYPQYDLLFIRNFIRPQRFSNLTPYFFQVTIASHPHGLLQKLHRVLIGHAQVFKRAKMLFHRIGRWSLSKAPNFQNAAGNLAPFSGFILLLWSSNTIYSMKQQELFHLVKCHFLDFFQRCSDEHFCEKITEKFTFPSYFISCKQFGSFDYHPILFFEN